MSDVKRLQRTAYIAKNIIELRESVGWSQSELARQINVTSAAISMIEKGNRMPSTIVMSAIAEAFHISLSELIGESVPINNGALHSFFMKYGDIINLSNDDQKIILSLVKRLMDSKNYE